MNLEVLVSYNAPSNASEWDRLAEANSNFFQSTHNDSLQAFYKQYPVYFEARDAGRLVGGVKIYTWESRKLGKLTADISRSAFQLAEMLSSVQTSSDEFALVKRKLKESLQQFIKQKKVNEYTVYGMYGDEALLIELDLQPKATFLFSSSYVDLAPPIEDVIKGFNRNTMRNYKKAEEAGLTIYKEDNIEAFLPVLNMVYGQQNPPHEPPSNNFIRHISKALAKSKALDVQLVKQGDEVLSSSFFVKFGANAYSWFGGSLKNQVGAGQFIYTKLMRQYKQEGITRFYFGQVERSDDKNENEKFSRGISTFKRGFGLVELHSFKKVYILNKTKKKIWDLLLKVKK